MDSYDTYVCICTVVSPSVPKLHTAVSQSQECGIEEVEYCMIAWCYVVLCGQFDISVCFTDQVGHSALLLMTSVQTAH